MASSQWDNGKLNSKAGVKAALRHNDKDMRLKDNHTNKDIDKELTPLNFSYRGLNYIEKCCAYDRRLSQIEYGREFKGRIVGQLVDVPCPSSLVNADYEVKRQWFKRVGDIAVELWGDNLIDMDVHFDELHEYVDARTGKTTVSREHAQLVLVPEVGGKLNGKAFYRRSTPNKFNSRIEKMSQDEFGARFMDGKGKGKSTGKKTVEELKEESVDKLHELTEEAEATLQRAKLRHNALDVREADLKAREDVQEAREASFRTEVEQFTAEKEKWLNEASRSLEELKADLKRNYEEKFNELHKIAKDQLAKQAELDTLERSLKARAGVEGLLPTNQVNKASRQYVNDVQQSSGRFTPSRKALMPELSS